MQSEACQNCHYFDPELNRCHRYAPEPMPPTKALEWDWPMVGPDDWCGDWRAGQPSAEKIIEKVDALLKDE